MPQISRRFFIGSLIAAPAIVRFPSLMKLPKYTIEDYAELAFRSDLFGVDVFNNSWQLWEFDMATKLWTRLHVIGRDEYGEIIQEEISV